MQAFKNIWCVVFFITLSSIAISAQDALPDTTTSLSVEDTIVSVQDSINTMDTTALEVAIDTLGQAQAENETYELENFEIPREAPADHTLLFYLFCLIFGIFIYVKIGFSGHYETLIRVLTNYRLARQYFNEGILKFTTPTMLLIVNSILIFGILLYLILRYLGVFADLSFGQLLTIASIIVASLIWIRYFVKLILAWLLPDGQRIQFYLFNIIIINLFLSMALFPLAILMAYVQLAPIEVFLIAAGAIFVIFSAYRIYRGMLIGKELFQLYKFHFILYLCTLEILPLLVLAKLTGLAF